ncbi:MAG: transketolase [Bacteriovorax sp.]|nr:transketolase [Bacteriovorax sp.]
MNEKLQILQYECAKKILDLSYKAKSGHIGSSLSCVSLLVDLFFHRKSQEDAFILSKGHAALALYCILNLKGEISNTELDSFYTDDTLLPAHTPILSSIKDISFGTGSLGHGLSLAVGVALGKKLKGEVGKVYCLLSDGECQEGSTWEALMFSVAKKLDNLVVLIDQNGLQAFSRTSEVIGPITLHQRLCAFGVDSVECHQGNDFSGIDQAYKMFKSDFDGPKALVAKTIKGHGVSFMEDQLKWHYLSLSKEQYTQALDDILKLKGQLQ